MTNDFGLRVAAAETMKELLGDVLEQEKANAAAISRDGNVIPDAVKNAIPWQRVTWYLASPSTGTNVSAEHPMPQGGVIRQISIRAKSPPSGGQLRMAVNTGSGDPIIVSLQPGDPLSSTPASQRCEPGSVLTLNVMNVSGASGVTVTVFFGGLT